MSVPELSILTLGGGCFWCTEAVYLDVRGVLKVEPGYCNGQAQQPIYEQVCTGRTGCNEVVKLTYDPAHISTRQILEIFFVVHDPTTLNQQGNDHGSQYRSGIYYSTAEQKQVAQALVQELADQNAFDRPIVTEILPLLHYWPAEEYHQNYFARNPYQGYCRMVAAPKVAKFRQTFAELSKS